MNDDQKRKLFGRGALALLILLSGIAFMPFTGFSSENLDWQLYAQVYQPVLTVDPDSGAPGSSFLFTGSGYPANTLASIYVDGLVVGFVETDGNGDLQFLIETRSEDLPGVYVVTAATDANTTASVEIELDTQEPVAPPPPDFEGPVFGLKANTYLPFTAGPP